jgi:hypothetical protein
MAITGQPGGTFTRRAAIAAVGLGSPVVRTEPDRRVLTGRAPPRRCVFVCTFLEPAGPPTILIVAAASAWAQPWPAQMRRGRAGWCDGVSGGGMNGLATSAAWVCSAGQEPAVFTALVGVGLTSPVWYFANHGVPSGRQSAQF